MKIIDKNIDELIPYENNPRRNDAAVEYVANSLKEFGWKQPVVIDKDGVIIAGHTRHKAALQLGMKTIPCLMADDLTPEQVKAYRLADNKVAELAGWDFEALEFELADLDMEFNMSNFGFDFIKDDEYTDDFTLKDGDRDPVQNMTFTFSDDEAEVIKEAISKMKNMRKFAEYDNPLNQNGNGNALFLVVEEWLQQKI